MEEENLKPFMDFEPRWHEETITLERRLHEQAVSVPAPVEMSSFDPSSLVAFARGEQKEVDVDALKELVIAFTDEHRETLLKLPRRECLLLLLHCPFRCFLI